MQLNWWSDQSQSTKLALIILQVVIPICIFEYYSMQTRNWNVSDSDLSFMATTNKKLLSLLHVKNIDKFRYVRADTFQHNIPIAVER